MTKESPKQKVYIKNTPGSLYEYAVYANLLKAIMGLASPSLTIEFLARYKKIPGFASYNPITQFYSVTRNQFKEETP